jgi:hypothetical protein
MVFILVPFEGEHLKLPPVKYTCIVAGVKGSNITIVSHRTCVLSDPYPHCQLASPSSQASVLH